MSSIKKITLFSMLTAAMPLIAFAAITEICTLLGKVFTIVTYFGTVVLIAAVVMLLYAGFLFMVGGGNEEIVKKAKSFLVWSLVGLAIALLAMSAAPIVRNIIGVDFLSGCPGVIIGQ